MPRDQTRPSVRQLVNAPPGRRHRSGRCDHRGDAGLRPEGLRHRRGAGGRGRQAVPRPPSGRTWWISSSWRASWRRERSEGPSPANRERRVHPPRTGSGHRTSIRGLIALPQTLGPQVGPNLDPSLTQVWAVVTDPCRHHGTPDIRRVGRPPRRVGGLPAPGNHLAHRPAGGRWQISEEAIRRRKLAENWQKPAKPSALARTARAAADLLAASRAIPAEASDPGEAPRA